ncbi:MAG: Lar family restriction alleviation protein [Selenomonadaceae bacterium]|nr:Lar family restriction alleviation protein [Selenomonadaceae bacterium]
MSEELKPCPFCGAKYSSEKFTAGTVQLMRGEKYFWAICLNCGVRTGEYLGDEAAIEAWNRRAKDE